MMLARKICLAFLTLHCRPAGEPHVQQSYYVTGDADFIMICVVPDMAEFEALTHRLFFENSNVRRFKTSVVMSQNKSGLSVPVLRQTR